MTDSLRAECLGCYGNRIIRTPNIDRLASEGVRFSSCFTQHTVCMPTRATLFTGRYTRSHGVWANGVPLRRSEITLPQVLAEAGYHTWMAGKMHLEPHRQKHLPPAGAPYYGFREYLISDNIQVGQYLDFVDRQFPRYAELIRKNQPGVPAEALQATWIADRTRDFLRSRRRQKGPFFAFCSMIDPKQPHYRSPTPFYNMYRWEDVPGPQREAGELNAKPPDKRRASERLKQRGLLPDPRELQQDIARYYGATSFVDWNVGRVLKTLEEERLADDTIVIFTTDHGEMIGDHWLRLKGPWMYDLVIHAPIIWRWPRHFGPGKVVEQFAEQVDLMPTLLEFAGVQAPGGLQGRSLAPLLEGRTVNSWREATLTEDRDSSELPAHGIEARDLSLKTIRTRNWKLTFYQGKPYGELFDLRNDPQEYDNLWADPARRRIRTELTQQLLDLLVATEDPLPKRIASA
jgi:arylsulfatase